ncbi:heme ABC transporter ATP-binding protein [Halobacterium litoreum]|uniref:Cobalamin import ATP-binding protein BtuD n=1 Tax=Halobacterium litoreum TaxID=2039234 RepID=A0ABD5NB57_9EURY|nr:heme ABC transporter ATP-binding protein [Halobacterium litoreum]UHH14613.1 heme ABC transporter ATP-binding protein [Halobacterium litoreum]
MTLDVRDVDVKLGGEQILDAVSANVEDGRLVGVVGPNGAGKSTLLRAMNGVIDPEAGTVLVDGDAVDDLPSKATSRRVATVPQDTHVSFEFTVRETVEMGRHPHVPRFGSDDDPEAVDRAMERAEVARFADRDVTSLSGGETQRVLLARALAQDAPVLLLDEPTASLDVNHQIRTLELVRDLAADADRAVVAAIHDLDLAARYCDELVLVAEGRVLDSGPPESVLSPEAVREAFDARVAVGTDPATGRPTVTPLPDANAALDGRVHVLGGGDAATPILRRLADAGADLSVGPVVDGDTDHETARRFGADCVTVPPFESPDAEAVARARTLVADADAVVVASEAADRGANPELRDAADATLVVGDDPVATRVAAEDVAAAVAAVEDDDTRIAVADGGGE